MCSVSNDELFTFAAILWQILKSHFERKQSKADYSKIIWKEEKCMHGFFGGLDHMHFSEKKLQKTTDVLVQELVK